MMHSHPRIVQSVEKRAFEERMGISGREEYIGQMPQRLTLGESVKKARQVIAHLASHVSTQARRTETNIASSNTA